MRRQFKSKDLVSPEGLRQDGRRPNEMRQLKAELGILPHADGSALWEMGNTRLIASVHGPLESPSSNDSSSSSSSGTVRVTLHQAAFSSSTQRRGKASNIPNPHTNRLEEWSRFLEETFGSVVMTSTFPRSAVRIYVQVISADGGILAAAISAISLALIDAGIPMIDYLLGGSLVHGETVAIFDTNRQEESSGAAVITVAVMPRSKAIAFLSMDPPPRIPQDRLEAVLREAMAGCQRLWEWLDGQIVRPHLIVLPWILPARLYAPIGRMVQEEFRLPAILGKAHERLEGWLVWIREMEEKLNRIDSQNTQIIESLEQLQLTMDQLLRLTDSAQASMIEVHHRLIDLQEGKNNDESADDELEFSSIFNSSKK